MTACAKGIFIDTLEAAIDTHSGICVEGFAPFESSLVLDEKRGRGARLERIDPFLFLFD